MNLKGLSPNTMFAMGTDYSKAKGKVVSSQYQQQSSPKQQINVQVLKNNKYEVKTFVEESDRGVREQLRIGKGKREERNGEAIAPQDLEDELVEEDFTQEALQVESKCFEGGNRVSA